MCVPQPVSRVPKGVLSLSALVAEAKAKAKAKGGADVAGYCSTVGSFVVVRVMFWPQAVPRSRRKEGTVWE